MVTGNTADLPHEITNALNISFVPIYVRFGEDIYLDAVDACLKLFKEQSFKLE